MINIKKKKKKDNNRKIMNLKLVVTGVVATCCFITVIVSLFVIQFIKGEEYSSSAYNQQVKNQIISSKRGAIYDSKGEVLAQSITVDTISLNPGKVVYSNNKKVEAEVIAEGLSNIFNITYEEVIQKLNSGSSVVVIEKKVETDKVTQLKQWLSEKGITAGINIDEDSKRYYPYNKLASNLLGFCGDDNSGLTGLEERWNDILTGTAGKVVTAIDVNNQPISGDNEQYVPAENGSNIYLTVDATIQAIAEKYLEQAVVENSCSKGGNVIIMNPQSGDILAMATYPNYNLNEPFSIETTGYTEEQWNLLANDEKTSARYNLWRNRAVSDLYEPGSTFKLLTAAIGLEENIVKTDTANNFYCSGFYHVGDYDIKCWRKEPHGSQSLRDALCNSCNPAFMQLGQKIGAKTLYKYFTAFGLFEEVGSDIAKAYSGVFHNLDSIGPVELATTSFGQRFTITPLQLITAVSAITNDGVLVKPRIVKQIENTDTGSIETVETTTERQVISEETSKQIKNMMQSVVTDGTGKHAAVSGYSIGGKSGTSEPTVGNESEGYVASFIAISPIENTQVVVLVVLYDPQGELHQGGQTAGPVASQILSEVLPYLGIASNAQKVEDNKDSLISVPNVKGKTVSEAKRLLQQLGFNAKINITGDEELAIITDQTPKSGIALAEGSVIYLYTEENDTRVSVSVPNIKGMTVSEATKTLKASNLNIQIDGTRGIVVSQDPTYETKVEVGTVINAVIKEELRDGQ